MSSSSPHEVILTSSPDGPIIAYDASSGTVVTRFAASRSPRRGLALVGKTSIVASHICPITASGSIHLYNWWSSTAFHKLPIPEPVAPLTATPDGSYLFAGGLSGTVYALPVASGDILNSLPAHTKPVSCLKISEDGSLLISGSDDGSIVVTPIFQLVGSPKECINHLILHKFDAHSGSVTAITSGTGICNSQVISCSMDSTCKFWSLLRGTHLRTVVFPCSILGITLNPSESDFYAAGSDGSIYKGPIRIGKGRFLGNELVEWAQNQHNGAIVAVAMVNNGRNLVSASEDGNVWVWESGSGQVVLGLGNELGMGISDLVVASGIRSGNEIGFGMGTGNDGLFGNEGISCLDVKETMEMEDVLVVAEKDRSRAIDLLESAIAMYERLLELILKEVKGASGGGSCNREVTNENENSTM
ncbi:Guanine nucleotide-binding protein, beta subunit [Parasponia andersonii]|uniref:Guanine nucleotide-binding protein, beta subunit n=1 Tax=Parasponia andersonii TaxID=3476 RepID=A0A2P5D981_PARAD|nr:Guanine nucleotide-binding protein, beta subunit [Parasponia andersonii]